MNGIFDSRSLIVTEITSLEFKLKALKLKKIFGLADEKEIARIEERIGQLKKELLNIPRWMS